jgi:hypothetical protein
MARIKLFILCLSVAVMFGVLTQPAGATSSLSLSDGTSTVTLSDSGIGSVSYNGSVGNFILNVTTGITYPILGTPGAPQLDLNSVNLSSSSGGTLTIMYSANNFTTLDAGISGLITHLGGTTTGTVDLKLYTDAANTLFGKTTLLANLGPYSSGAFSGSVQTNVQPTGPYSLTLVATVAHNGGGVNVTSFNGGVAPVPEPATSLLLGVGLVGAGLWRKFKQPSV